MKKFFAFLFAAAAFELFQLPAWAAGTTDAGTNPDLQVPIISDVHINQSIPGRTTRFQAALQDYNQIAPGYQAIAVDGDLTDYGTDEQYQSFMNTLNTYMNPNAEKVLVMGNHEFYQGVYWPNPNYTDQMFIQRFITNTGMPSLYYDKWVQGANLQKYHFIVLGSEQSRATDPTNYDYAVLSDQQLQWLQDTIKQDADPKKPIFVFLHEPIDNTVYGSDEWGGHVDPRLKEILQQYPQTILFTGHLHYLLSHPRSVYQDGFTMANTGAVAYTLYEGGSAPAEYSEGLLVNVYDDHVEIKAREFSNHTWINDYTIPLPFRKTIDDTEKPTFPAGTQVSTSNVTATSATITWTPATDNTMVDKYLIKQNGQVVQTVYNKFWEKPGATQYSADLTNLTGNTNYTFEITAVDAWNNESDNPLTVNLTTDKYNGWVKNGSNTYYYDYNTGQKVTGWLKDQSKWYYFDANGLMKTGWVNDGGKWYYLGNDGVMKTGWVKVNSIWYYLDSSGVMKTGWFKDGQTWYYLDKSGVMHTGWLNDSGTWYYLNSNGSMQIGWTMVNNKWYYFYSNGKMAVNTKIGTYRIGKDGAWIH